MLYCLGTWHMPEDGYLKEQPPKWQEEAGGKWRAIHVQEGARGKDLAQDPHVPARCFLAMITYKSWVSWALKEML